MEDYLVRPIEPRDIERVLGIITRNDEADEEVARRFFKDYFSKASDDPRRGSHFVVESDEELFAVGGYMVSEDTGEFWVGFLFVDPYYQGQRLGTTLLEKISTEVMALGGERLLVTVGEEDIPAQTVRFYEVNGFEMIELDETPPVLIDPDYRTYRKLFADKP